MRQTQPASKGLRLFSIASGALLSNLLIATLGAPATYAQTLTASVPTALAQLVQQSAPKAIAEVGKRATPTGANSSFASVDIGTAPSIRAAETSANESFREQAKPAKEFRSDKTSRSAAAQPLRDRSAH